jgi:hypothetical protein
MPRKRKLDLEKFVLLAYDQLQEDRQTIKDFYEKFKDQVVTTQDLAVNGSNLTKCLELMIKQTSQLIEVMKVESSKKNAEKDMSLSDDEKDQLYSQLMDDKTDGAPQ